MTETTGAPAGTSGASPVDQAVTAGSKGSPTRFAEDFLPPDLQDSQTRYRAEHAGPGAALPVAPTPPRAGCSPSPVATGTTLLADTEFEHDERIIINMGPQHPSTHGVLRLILELEGETVVQARSVIGYLHTGIEKSCEYRTWTQGVTFVTRADYLSPAFNEAAYCMAVEKLLGIEVPRPGPGHPGAADGADPDLLAPGGAGHRRHGTRAR